MLDVFLCCWHRFQRQEAGTITVETLLILPLVLWAFLATFVFFDAFSAKTTAERAAYTVSDAIGRQQNTPLTAEEIDGFNEVFAYLARNQPETRLRVSSVIWNPINEEYEVVWSYATNNGDILTNDDFTPELLERLPVLPNRESVYITETEVQYVPTLEALPFMGVILQSQALRQFIIARPRFTPQLRFDDGSVTVGGTFPTCDDPGVICGSQGPE